MGEIEDIASSVMLALLAMRHAAKGDHRRMRAELRQRLQTYVTQVMAATDGIGQCPVIQKSFNSMLSDKRNKKC